MAKDYDTVITMKTGTQFLSLLYLVLGTII